MCLAEQPLHLWPGPPVSNSEQLHKDSHFGKSDVVAGQGMFEKVALDTSACDLHTPTAAIRSTRTPCGETRTVGDAHCEKWVAMRVASPVRGHSALPQHRSANNAPDD
jgi:hypothetical protein